MAEPTLVQVYGTNATQTISILTLSKTDFAVRGLTASAANTAEGMLVAILLQAASVLTEETRLTDLVNRNVTIVYSGQDLIDQGGGNIFLRDTYQVSLYKATTLATISPNNY